MLFSDRCRVQNQKKNYIQLKTLRMSKQVPLSSLAQSPKADCHKPEPECPPQECDPCHDAYTKTSNTQSTQTNGGYGGYFAWAILWFIILAVIIWLILAAAKPTWVQKVDEKGQPTGELDNGKACLWAVIIAFIICVIIWILKALVGACNGGSW